MIAIGPPTLEVRVSIWPGTRLSTLVGGVSGLPDGNICVSRVSRVTLGVTIAYVGSYGTEAECMCLNAKTHATGSRNVSLATSAPGVEPRETTGTQCTGCESSMI